MTIKAIIVALGSAISLTACNTLLESHPPEYPIQSQERFPIQVANAPTTLEIYPMENGRVDAAQKEDLVEFAKTYRRSGKSYLTVAVPSREDGRIDPGVAAHTRLVMQVLQSHGVPKGAIQGQTYQPAGGIEIPPIRLTYAKPQATIDSACGLWTDDVGFGSIGTDIDNLPYYNHGCATQANVALQIADPMDIVRQRKPAPADATRAVNVVTRYRSSAGTEFTESGNGGTSKGPASGMQSGGAGSGSPGGGAR